MTYQRLIILEPYLRGQHNLYAMKQINKKGILCLVPSPDVFILPLAKARNPLALLRRGNYALALILLLLISPLYHEFDSCGQSFCNPGVVMLYVVVEYLLKLPASAQTRRL